jgi:hypothetical protein
VGFLENGARRVVIRRDVMVDDHSLLRRAACRHVPPGLHVLDNTFGSAIGENVMMPQAAPLLSAGVASAGPPAAAEVEAYVGSAEPPAAAEVEAGAGRAEVEAGVGSAEPPAAAEVEAGVGSAEPPAAAEVEAGVGSAEPSAAAEVEAGVGSAEPYAAETVVAESEPRETTELFSATIEPPLAPQQAPCPAMHPLQQEQAPSVASQPVSESGASRRSHRRRQAVQGFDPTPQTRREQADEQAARMHSLQVFMPNVDVARGEELMADEHQVGNDAEQLSYYIDISPNYSLIIPKTAVLSIRGLGPGA